jgi:hypothetical protein
MKDEKEVTRCRYPNQTNLLLRYVDPITGRQETESARTPNEQKAIGIAGRHIVARSTARTALDQQHGFFW